MPGVHRVGATPGTRRTISTRPSPTSTRRSGSIPGRRRRTPTGARLGQQGRVRQGDRRLRRGHPARSRIRPEPTSTGATPGCTKGDTDKAIADFDEAIRLDPENAEAYSNRGTPGTRKRRLRQGHRRLHRGDPARSRGRRSASTTGARLDARMTTTRPSPTTTRPSGSIPESPDAYGSRGYRMEHPEGITTRPSPIQRGDPARSPATWVFCYRGRARLAREELEAAVADFDEAIRLDPNLAPAYRSRGNARLSRNSTTPPSLTLISPSGSTPRTSGDSVIGAMHGTTRATSRRPSPTTARRSVSNRTAPMDTPRGATPGPRSRNTARPSPTMRR